MVSTTEFVGGMLLLAGLGSRFACVPLAITMGVAIYTEWAGPEKGDNVLDTVLRNVLDGDPGPFLVAVLIILIMGPGKLSLDALIERFVK